MNILYTNENLAFIRHLKVHLDNLGIKAIIKNEYQQGAAGGVDATCWPELCILDQKDFNKAKDELNKIISNGNDSYTNWICNKCKEDNEGQFAICWSCGNSDSSGAH